VRFLSGGERNRALLARLMTRPANVIVLDEPTNDLDSETLELLEEQLAGFSGTLLMVSHDRTFLNNVVTSTIVFENETAKEYAGGYDDWQAAVSRQEPVSAPEAISKRKLPERIKQAGSNKLSYNDQRELEQLPQRIEDIEAQIEAMHQSMADPEYYQQGGDTIASDATKLKSLETDLATAYARWEELM
jgi:ATP-binding cassette subfamily F protein uup